MRKAVLFTVGYITLWFLAGVAIQAVAMLS
jgi:hypothetical protein